MIYLLDSGAYTFLVRNRPAIVNLITDDTLLYMCTPVIGELYYGINKSDSVARNLLALEHFLKEPVVKDVDMDMNIAKTFGAIKATQSRVGLTLGINDLWIAATAIELDATLITYDTDFEKIKDPRFAYVLLADD